MRTVADEVEELGAKMGFPLFRRDIDDRTTWVVVDCVDVVVHVFEPNTRAHYDLEMLWADAPRLEWERGRTNSKPAATTAQAAASDANGEIVAVKKKATTRKKKTTGE
jgi:ribosome-associated protein